MHMLHIFAAGKTYQHVSSLNASLNALECWFDIRKLKHSFHPTPWVAQVFWKWDRLADAVIIKKNPHCLTVVAQHPSDPSRFHPDFLSAPFYSFFVLFLVSTPGWNPAARNRPEIRLPYAIYLLEKSYFESFLESANSLIIRSKRLEWTWTYWSLLAVDPSPNLSNNLSLAFDHLSSVQLTPHAEAWLEGTQDVKQLVTKLNQEQLAWPAAS